MKSQDLIYQSSECLIKAHSVRHMTSRSFQFHASPQANQSFPKENASGKSLGPQPAVHSKNVLKVKEKENRVRMYKIVYFDPIIALLFYISSLQM